MTMLNVDAVKLIIVKNARVVVLIMIIQHRNSLLFFPFGANTCKPIAERKFEQATCNRLCEENILLLNQFAVLLRNDIERY